MTPEGIVKAAVKKILGEYSNVWWMMPVSTGYGKVGIPDFLVVVNGKFFAYECKSMSGKVTTAQNKQMEEIAAAGGHVFVINPTNVNLVRGNTDCAGGIKK